ncbi:MAG: MATE family efflux transporter [Nitrososphaerales archaeon]
MSKVHVRRAGLVSFAIRLGSVFTGLVFTLLVSSNVSLQEFGLWGLLTRTIGYVLFPGLIISFWTTRYRARGMLVGRTILAFALITSVLLALLYVVLSPIIAATAPQADPSTSNSFYFLISTPQVVLYTLTAALEALILSTSPEKSSLGFVSFEIAKVCIALVAIVRLHLSFEGAILSVIGAQVVQIIVLLFFTKNEYGSTFSFGIIKTMMKNGWVALLDNLHPIVTGFDFLIIAIFTHSTDLLGLFSAATIIAMIGTYSSFLSSGLYPTILAGRDPQKASNQIIELQLFFLFPMLVGEAVLAPQLLDLLNPKSSPPYSSAVPILLVLVIWSAVSSFQFIFDSIISGSDTTDKSESATFSHYLKSKLFLLSKINLLAATGYMAFLIVIGVVYGSQISSIFFGFPGYVFLGILWAIGALGRSMTSFLLKLHYSKKITRISIQKKLFGSLGIASFVFAFILYFLTIIISKPSGGILVQVAYIALLGVISLIAYVAVVVSLQPSIREFILAVLKTVFQSKSKRMTS